jgi:hypothetical protein
MIFLPRWLRASNCSAPSPLHAQRPLSRTLSIPRDHATAWQLRTAPASPASMHVHTPHVHTPHALQERSHNRGGTQRARTHHTRLRPHTRCKIDPIGRGIDAAVGPHTLRHCQNFAAAAPAPPHPLATAARALVARLRTACRPPPARCQTPPPPSAARCTRCRPRRSAPARHPATRRPAAAAPCPPACARPCPAAAAAARR